MARGPKKTQNVIRGKTALVQSNQRLAGNSTILQLAVTFREEEKDQVACTGDRQEKQMRTRTDDEVKGSKAKSQLEEEARGLQGGLSRGAVFTRKKQHQQR